MNAATSHTAGYQVDDLLVDVSTRRVLRAGVDLEVTSLSFDLLLALARAAPGLVTFEQLMEQVWPGMVVSPETLTQRVKLLRQALGDSADNPRYILAIRGHGYRLLAAALPLAAQPSQPAAQPSVQTPTVAVASRFRWSLAASIVLTGAAMAWWAFAPGGLLRSRPAAASAATGDAYQFFMQAESVVNGTPESFRAAVALYDEALARDPRFARALSGRAMNRAALVWTGSPLGRGLEDAQRDAEQALALDPAESRAHVVLASMSAMRGDWSAAEAGFHSALSLSPRDADIHGRYAVTLLLATGQLRKAAGEAAQAQALAPGSSFPAAILAFSNHALGADEEAVRFAQLSESRGGDSRQLAPVYAAAAAARGQYLAAANHASKVLPAGIRDVGGEAKLQLAYAALGNPQQQVEALAALRTLTQDPAWDRADPRSKQTVLYLFAALGALDDVYHEMDRMLRGDSFPQIIAIASMWSPQMRPFRQDRRFQELVQRLGLMDYWKKSGPPDGCGLVGPQVICR